MSFAWQDAWHAAWHVKLRTTAYLVTQLHDTVYQCHALAYRVTGFAWNVTQCHVKFLTGLIELHCRDGKVNGISDCTIAIINYAQDNDFKSNEKWEMIQISWSMKIKSRCFSLHQKRWIYFHLHIYTQAHVCSQAETFSVELTSFRLRNSRCTILLMCSPRASSN